MHFRLVFFNLFFSRVHPISANISWSSNFCLLFTLVFICVNYFSWLQNLNSFWSKEKMLAKGANTSSVVSNISRKRCFDELSNQVGFSTDWRYHPELVYKRYDQSIHKTIPPKVAVSLTDSFRRDQIEEHISSLRKESDQVGTPPSSNFNYHDLFRY